MYDTIMNALMAGAVGGMTKEAYALSLKPAAAALWGAYQQGNSIAKSANYSDQDVNAAYMLRYFPYYTHIVDFILREHPKAAPQWREPTDVALFGAGPAPEIVSIARYFKAVDEPTLLANVHAFDINTCWDFYQENVSRKLVSNLRSIETLNFIRKTFDLRKASAVTGQVRSVVSNCELIVSQNCINEVDWEDRDVVVQNFAKIFTAMKPQATLIIACRGLKYDTANYILAGAVAAIGKYCAQIIHASGALACGVIDQHLPDYILNKLLFRAPPLVSGLTLARNFEFIYVIAKKSK